MTTKKGIVKRVSSQYAGLMLDDSDKWFNADKSCNDQVVEGLKGSCVELVLNDKGKFTSVTVVGGTAGSNQKPNLNGSGGYWEEKAVRDAENDVKRGRGAALNTSVELVGLALRYGSADFQGADQNGKLGPGGLLDACEVLALRIVEFVNKK